MVHSPPGSSVHGILQARILGLPWVGSGLPCLPPGDLPDPGIKPMSPALAGGFFTSESPGKPCLEMSSQISIRSSGAIRKRLLVGHKPAFLSF